ncbi:MULTISPECIES: ABC transporter ATP-binding protein [unclassified Paraburkholderia]|uniref:ABC transporter ATP-binding protein n=1 Tax=unclassified Paraburkholderia TaxID=2615204 RepID=UPI002AAF76CC|nr:MULTISPECIES: ABC transporter ATP-binding protein [unclassified Paraburkholderia]
MSTVTQATSKHTDTAQAAVVFEGVRKRWGQRTVLDDLSLTIARGKLTTLLGPSGCGKTTMLRLIAGLDLPDAGRIVIGGRDVTRLGAQARNVSMVFQSYALFPHLSVADNVGYGLSVARVPKRDVAARVEMALARVGLSACARRMPHELSGGQQQRVAVARALVLEPEVMLFDEPLSNLDARLRVQVREEIRDLQRELDLSVVYVTHDQEEALAISDEIVVMEAGAVAQHADARSLVERPANAFVASFIGNANFLALPVLSCADGRAHCDLSGVPLDLAWNGPRIVRARIAVRPEALALEIIDHFAPHRGLAGVIRRATWLGRSTHYTVETTAGDLTVSSHSLDRPLAEGARVAVTLDARGAHLLGEAS